MLSFLITVIICLTHVIPNAKSPSIPALLKTFSQADSSGPGDLSVNRKKCFKNLLIEKRSS